MTTPKLLSREELDDALSRCQLNDDEAAIRGHIAALEADNAAMVARAKAVMADTRTSAQRQRVALYVIGPGPHPGAALLEELAALKGDERWPPPGLAQRTVRELVALLEPYAAGEEGNKDVVGRVERLLEQHRKAVEPLRAIVDGLASEMERTIAHKENRGGMQVPDHGDFCNAPPSMLGRMRWWVREMRAALAGHVSGVVVRARNEGLEKARRFVKNSGSLRDMQLVDALAENIDAMKEPEE